MARFSTVGDIINQTAVEVGLLPVSNPVDSPEELMIQMVGLLNSAGLELCELHPWQMLVRPFEVITEEGDTGIYDLPDDFNYMIDQTGWDRKNRVAVAGPLSPQDWTYLAGRDLVSQSIYVSFRQWEGKLYLFPQPPPVDMRITFEYSSRGWLQDPADPENRRDKIGSNADVCLLPALLVTKFLKLKFLQAKGFDSAGAALEFDNLLGQMMGRDTGAPILNADRNSRGFPYLSSCRNLGDSGYGL